MEIYSFSTTISAKISEGLSNCRNGFAIGGSQTANPPLTGLWMMIRQKEINVFVICSVAKDKQ